MKPKIITTTAILFTFFILFIIYSANRGDNLIFFRMLKKLPMGDKVGHVILVGTFTFLVNWALQARTILLGQRSLLLGSCMVFLVMTIEEFSQIWIANRTFDWMDLVCNYVGILIASLLILKVFITPKQ